MKLSRFNSTQLAIRDLFITGIKARINSSIAADSKLPMVHHDDVYVLLTQMDALLFFYVGSEPNRVVAIKLMREFHEKFSETIEFTVYDEKLALALRDSARHCKLEKPGEYQIFTKFINRMTLQEAKDIVDSYDTAICKYADSSNRLSKG